MPSEPRFKKFGRLDPKKIERARLEYQRRWRERYDEAMSRGVAEPRTLSLDSRALVDNAEKPE